MLDIAIPQIQISLLFIEYRETNIEYLLAKSSGASNQKPATRNQQPGTSSQRPEP